MLKCQKVLMTFIVQFEPTFHFVFPRSPTIQFQKLEIMKNNESH